MVIIYGKNIIKEAIKAQRKIYFLYINPCMKDKVFLNFILRHHLNYCYLDKHQLNNKVQNNNHQGVVAEVQDYSYRQDLLKYLIEKSDRIVKFLILDAIQDPHNFGAIIRTVEASDFDGIIVSKKHQVPLNGTVAKTSSGALEYVNIFLVCNLYQTILTMQKFNFIIIGTEIGIDNNLDAIPLDQSLAIILGNEGIGMRSLLKKKCNYLVSIPTQGMVNSLNVSVSAAIIIFYLYMKNQKY
ncbi:MAG: 23S rRNA (guanosine(2251)-2'-O)-methyltransferase RlmB [Pigeon pea little leaf phytoplasma]|uniref:23S rRNA (Guanosine(2251)-2'-O)-methyltransferase RlmB n=1 Tax=Candidatus Phytoplasma fabacearum TaxID=2982628 RepID=A0ABU8ZS54_9MOLU|nr:23S rRNA (guanosine(2251)-2'-O)-methyltransferase RlmB ['Bituminaria bituminosa' little leaf phytoplasma]MDV3148630.1 23S rRNA (guanosine(2251)-2'-O)-methyltransferase RlmB [Pigeon pea little leaf phytoplasma]MDO7983505.1 23S rRNA (guanosine(2251)-2'-O)-methyltransferase RlmB ['Bituminaria bituminosa' little leaf phytoplasma]MDO8023797.1 23S rRNA (guanosine(2251)-2'-O)-methyltransferase RlmB ['Bituminaria bituminosa' little leaf phytoplasma]MDO8030625.1 23S rRNA (guanosine(2251)-2'-O)-methyl